MSRHFKKKKLIFNPQIFFFLRIGFLACFSYTLAQSEDRYLSKFEPTGLDSAEHLCIGLSDGVWVKMLVFLSVKWGGWTISLRSLLALTPFGQFHCCSFMLHLRTLQSSKRGLLKTLDSWILTYYTLKSVVIWCQ